MMGFAWLWPLCLMLAPLRVVAGAPLCTSPESACLSRVSLGPQRSLELYSNFDLSKQNLGVTRAVVVIHGLGRDFAGPFAQISAVIATHLELQGNTLVLAPHFPALVDRPGVDFPYWDPNGWPAGDDSLSSNPVSSYEMLDELLKRVLDGELFPALRELTVTGMSAGGQFTQRYAAGSTVSLQYPAVHFRYVVVSPSSYMYLNSVRWSPGTRYEFAEPSSADCAYNNYRYGVDHLNPYMSRKSPSDLIADYVSRDINYAVGQLDDATVHPAPAIPHDPKDGADLDVSCAAEMQGPSRYMRALIYDAYLSEFFPQARHMLRIAPGVAHQIQIFSDPGVASLWLGPS